MASTNWRTINIDLLDPESPANFPLASLTPSIPPVSASEIQTLSGQIKQLLRGGDTEGALRGALENAPYGGEAGAKETHLTTLLETLHSIKQSDMSPLLARIYASPAGPDTLDVLMKYLYKGMSQQAPPRATAPPQQATGGGFSQMLQHHPRGGGEGGGQAMSVLLSWHEKVVEVAGLGCVVRVMTDRRIV